MAECYADYYTNKNQILTMIEYGIPKERQIALGSLIIHFPNEDHFDLCWRIFLSDEHRDVKYHALDVACRFATNKKIFEMTEYALRHDTKDNRYARTILWELFQRYKDKKIT